MSEVQLHEHQPFLPTTPLQVWAVDAAEAYKVASSLVKTSFVPNTLRGKPEEAAAAILTGQEIGLSPMAALRSIDIIAGTPAMRAHALRGLVQSQGHEVWVERASDSEAVVRGRRKGSDVVQESVWDLERARALGLLGKDAWKKQPKAMLIARATAECCRLTASDVLLGLPYAAEELEDDEPAQPTPIKRIKRATAPQVEPPALEPVESAAADSEPEPASPEPDLSGDWPEVAQPGEVGA